MTRTADLLDDFHTAPSSPSLGRIYRNNREWCIIALHDAWVSHCRALVLTSAVAGCETLAGVRVPPVAGVRNANRAVALVRASLAPKAPAYWEPRWGDAREAIRAAQALGINNFVQVSGALGSTPSPAEDLRVVRNYVAHRNHTTAPAVRRLTNLAGFVDPTLDGYLIAIVGPLESRYRSWVRELRSIATAAVR